MKVIGRSDQCPWNSDWTHKCECCYEFIFFRTNGSDWEDPV